MIFQRLATHQKLIDLAAKCVLSLQGVQSCNSSSLQKCALNRITIQNIRFTQQGAFSECLALNSMLYILTADTDVLKMDA